MPPRKRVLAVVKIQLQAGAVNQILLDLHLVHQPVGFETDPGWAYLTVLITNIWIGVPFNMVLIYSGLQGITGEFYEAASIDGANKWQQFWYITLPLLRPVIGVVLLLVTSALLEKINLTIGVIGHEGSTVLVILNGLLLLRFRGSNG